MIPRAEIDINASVPPGWAYWTPSREDLADPDGFGYFHDKWRIGQPAPRDVKAVVAAERTLCDLVDKLAHDNEEFDDLAAAFERPDRDRVPDRLDRSPFIEEIEDAVVFDDWPPLEGLELGVAGLVYALNSVRCWTAASCRGHGPGGWAPHPCVYVAATRHRVSLLQELMVEAGCGFVVDEARGQFLAVVAPSIKETMALAERVMKRRSEFAVRRGPRTRRPEPPPSLW